MVASRPPSPSQPTFICRSPGLRRVIAQAERIAPTLHSVLITGETGTGKEVMARFIHDRSGRTGPFIAVNCAALPKELVESELFGHDRGSFTGAAVNKRGLIREAHGGTLFLDEIGDMPLDVQVKVLRVLQERRVRPVGGSREEPVDVRVVAATLKNIEAEVAAGRFREDLRYRLGTFELALPPLRERGDDVGLLARSFVDAFAHDPGVGARTLGRSALSALRGHTWPGNVRELRLVLLRAALLGGQDVISGSDVRRVLAVPQVEQSLGERLTIMLKNSGPVSMGQITAALRVPRTTAWRELASLTAAGAVRVEGVGKGRRYRSSDGCERESDGDERASSVLDFARAAGRVTRQQVVRELGLPERTASRLLSELVSRGHLVGVGRGRAAAYALIVNGA